MQAPAVHSRDMLVYYCAVCSSDRGPSTTVHPKWEKGRSSSASKGERFNGSFLSLVDQPHI